MQDDEDEGTGTVFHLNDQVRGPGYEDVLLEAGSVSTVTLEEVRRTLLLSHGEVILSEHDLRAQFVGDDGQGEYVDQVVEMLTELGHYDEAIEIALSFQRDSSAYCLSKMVAVSCKR